MREEVKRMRYFQLVRVLLLVLALAALFGAAKHGGYAPAGFSGGRLL